MKNSKKALLCLLACALAVTGCKTQKEPAVADNAMLVRSTQTLDSLYAHYSAPGTCLLRENYPSDVEGYTATYLASEEQKNRPNLYSYLWPYSGTFSAVNALMEATKDNKKDFGNYQKLLDEKVLPGLAEYFDTRRMPKAYASYIKDAPLSDRFYDDNVWLGIDFTDVYLMTSQERQAYLEVYRKRYGRLFGRRYLLVRTEEGIKEHLFQRPWFRLCPETFQGYARQLLF